MSSPNPLRAAWSMLRARRVAQPFGHGTGRVDHAGFAPVLQTLAGGGVPALVSVAGDLDDYVSSLASIDPAVLTGSESLAYWLNLYNAGSLALARRALASGATSVLRVPGAFDAPVVRVVGEDLSLDAVEHGKIRRFGDPRIHAALVCGSVSCPTLRFEPYEGGRLEEQLDDQLRTFLAYGGAVIDEPARTVRLSRVFLWYGGDFTRPDRMPTWLPARRRVLLRTLGRWLDDMPDWVGEKSTSIEYQRYDWSLGCSVR